ncbi:transketolase [Methylotuvimicrobium sp. KM2]|uniref:transketolase n=1 Tax=Methylotuvimicrobium sp. KM2 TaxID=3133976 RepID=UPI0031010073
MNELSIKANQIRRDALFSIYHAGSGHPGGALSCADLLAYLFFAEGGKTKQDRFILSKGHSCPILYAVLAEAGWIPKSSLISLRKLGSPLQGHPHVSVMPAVEASTGSLGQGFSIAIGMAMGLRQQNDPSRVYVMLGDGELQEGEVWEGAMCAAQFELDKLCAIVDYNKIQSDDFNDNIIGLEPLRAKWEAFGWLVVEIDGHDFEQIDAAFITAKSSSCKPVVIIAHTVKGQGVSYMAGVPAWHGSVKLRAEELQQALRDLGTEEDRIPAYLDGSIWSERS